MGKLAEPMKERADEQQATAEVGGFQVMFKIPGRVSLGASEGAKSLRVFQRNDRARTHGACRVESWVGPALTAQGKTAFISSIPP